MKWRNRKQSTNVDDRRSHSGGGVGLPSIGTILFVWPVIKGLFRSKLGLAILGIGVVAYLGGFIDLPLLGGGSNRVIDEEADYEQAAFITHGTTELQNRLITAVTSSVHYSGKRNE
jgi:predicted metalloprotease